MVIVLFIALLTLSPKVDAAEHRTFTGRPSRCWGSPRIRRFEKIGKM